MKRVVVTGATGFVARHLVPRLLADGWQVIGTARAAACPRWLDGIDWINFDPCEGSAAVELLAKLRPQALVHLSGRVHGSYPQLCAANVMTVSHLLQAVREAAPGLRLVLFGSAAEYGAVPEDALPIRESARCEPVSGYGVTKHAATCLALAASREWQARISVVRPFNVVGAHMTPSFVAGALIKRIDDAMRTNSDKPVAVGRVDTTRDFVDVGDLSAAVTRLLDLDTAGDVYNLCSGRETSIRELLDTILGIAGGGLSWKVDPALVRSSDVARSFGSFELARKHIGFEPRTTLEESIRVAWQARRAEPAL